jgi:hypothetical protein
VGLVVLVPLVAPRHERQNGDQLSE